MLNITGLFNAFKGNTTDERDVGGETKLLRAVREGAVTKVKKILNDGANPNIANHKGLTPLHLAAYWGEKVIVETLIRAGADVNADNGKGWTPLHSASIAGGMKSRGDIVQRLLNAHADDTVKDRNGWTPAEYRMLWEKNEMSAEKRRQFNELSNNLPKRDIPPSSAHNPAHPSLRLMPRH